MKRVLCLAIATFVIVTGSITLSVSQAQSQPLGDYARAVKKAKAAPAKASKVYENDTLPNKGTVSVVGPAATETSAGTDNKDQAKDDGSKKPENPEIKPEQSSEDRKKSLDDWKHKIDDQKGKVDLLSRELELLQKERQVKQSDFYASTARLVQNPRGFDEEDAKYKQQIEEKQKSLDDAKGKLNGLQDEAHKSGVPTSDRE